MGVYSEETTKRFNRMFASGCALAVVQYFDLQISKIPLIGIEKIEPHDAVRIMAIIVLIFIVAFGLSYMANDASHEQERKFANGLNNFENWVYKNENLKDKPNFLLGIAEKFVISKVLRFSVFLQKLTYLFFFVLAIYSLFFPA
ncbi:MAG: hypothetical protein OCD03_13195 [Hyphomicrobiales bacterium]